MPTKMRPSSSKAALDGFAVRGTIALMLAALFLAGAVLFSRA